MRRREFIAALGGVVAMPLTVPAQDKIRRVGVLITLTKDNVEGQARLNSLVKGLETLGWTHTRNIHIDDRWPGDDVDRLRTDAADLVNRQTDVIVAGGSRSLFALQEQTRTIPIVFVAAAGTTEHGLVTNAARPAGNITGYTTFDSFALAGKLLGGLKDIAPEVARVILIMHRGHPSLPGYRKEFEAAAKSLGVVPITTDAASAAELESIITTFAREPHGGLVMPADQFNVLHRDLIIALAARHRLPAVYAYRAHAEAGGLISYGTDFSALYGVAAGYVDRILKGEKPSDLPVQSPMRYQLTINLKTAKTLGLVVSPLLLARADEVIE
jgi:putative ABC transport system substrate-binding protein